MQNLKPDASPISHGARSAGSASHSPTKKEKLKHVHYDEREFQTKLKAAHQPNESQVYQMRVLYKCIDDLRKREYEELYKLVDQKNDDKNTKQNYQEEAVIDPVKMASMLVNDNKLFLEPKKLEKNDGEEDEFQLKFDLREQ